MENYFRSFIHSVLSVLFPPVCAGCGKNIDGGEIVCRFCFGKITLNKSLFCGKCGARLPENKKICHPDFPYILGAAASYKDDVPRRLVHELKFKFVKDAARPLAEILIAYAKNLNLAESLPAQAGGWLVVPVPLGKKRLRRRGFNQADLIAEIFAGHFGLEAEKGGLVRLKETKPQSEMDNFESRLKNAKGCFAVVAPEKFAGRNIFLVDDVTTSGATFFEAAVSLKKAGARKIIALAAVKG
ncbi:MAG: double zinc ribbon domain-containing protein [Patescibacteria group bacterium]